MSGTCRETRRKLTNIFRNQGADNETYDHFEIDAIQFTNEVAMWTTFFKAWSCGQGETCIFEFVCVKWDCTLFFLMIEPQY